MVIVADLVHAALAVFIRILPLNCAPLRANPVYTVTSCASDLIFI
jgi:hypothetical protein